MHLLTGLEYYMESYLRYLVAKVKDIVKRIDILDCGQGCKERYKHAITLGAQRLQWITLWIKQSPAAPPQIHKMLVKRFYGRCISRSTRVSLTLTVQIILCFLKCHHVP